MKNNKLTSGRATSLFTAFAAFTLLLSLSFCRRSDSGDASGWQRCEGFAWNTSWHVTYRGTAALADSIPAVLARVGGSLSVFDTASLVSRVNMRDSTPVDNDFIRVYVMARKISRASGGAFDPTVSPLVTAWGFGRGHRPTADTLRIDSLLRFVGIDKTRLSHDALVKDDPRIEFNFSAIAKGYGCDAVGEMLARNGVRDFLVEIGGEIMAVGNNPEGGKWRVSVDRPIFSADTVTHESQQIIAFTDMGVATSGNYRNFRREWNRVFGHTISPLTGRPAETDVLSATVLAPTAMEADGLATAFMSMGSVKSRELCRSLRRPVMLVLADSTVWMSDQFKKLIVEE